MAMNERLIILYSFLLFAAPAWATTIYGPDGGLEVTQTGNIYWVRNLNGGPTYTVLPMPGGLLILNPSGSSSIIPYEPKEEEPDIHKSTNQNPSEEL